MRSGKAFDPAIYAQALPLYGRNLGVLLPPLIAAAIQLGLGALANPLTDPVGGMGVSIFAWIAQVVLGFAFGTSLIFADGAWRYGRANLAMSWNETKRKAGPILIAVIGFLFLVYVAQLIGGFLGPIGAKTLGAIAVFFLIYAVAAAALGGIAGTSMFDRSLRIARDEPLATAVLAVVSIAVWYFVGLWLPVYLGPFVGFGWYAVQILCPAIAYGYIALIVAKQYASVAFTRYW